MYGGFLCPVLLSKILPELQLIISRKVFETDWKLDTLMRAIEEEIVTREQVGAGQRRPRHNMPESNRSPTAATLVSGEDIKC